MAFSQHYSDIFTALNYTNESYDGDYRWTGDTPSAGIIAAVQALPGTAVALWNVDLTTDSDALALQAEVSGAAWSTFSAWHNEQWLEACDTALNAGAGCVRRCIGLYNG